MLPVIEGYTRTTNVRSQAVKRGFKLALSMERHGGLRPKTPSSLANKVYSASFPGDGGVRCPKYYFGVHLYLLAAG